jgi:hypothetical protein
MNTPETMEVGIRDSLDEMAAAIKAALPPGWYAADITPEWVAGRGRPFHVDYRATFTVGMSVKRPLREVEGEREIEAYRFVTIDVVGRSSEDLLAVVALLPELEHLGRLRWSTKVRLSSETR